MSCESVKYHTSVHVCEYGSLLESNQQREASSPLSALTQSVCYSFVDILEEGGGASLPCLFMSTITHSFKSKSFGGGYPLLVCLFIYLLIELFVKQKGGLGLNWEG